VNRTWFNVILSQYDKSESTKLLKELPQRAESDEPKKTWLFATV